MVEITPVVWCPGIFFWGYYYFLLCFILGPFPHLSLPPFILIIELKLVITITILDEKLYFDIYL